MIHEYNIVFFGTPEFAAAHLRALIESNEKIAGVVSRPDKSRGRGRKLSDSPVKRLAVDNRIEILQTEKLIGPEIVSWLKEKNPWLFVTAAYGLIVPPEILSIPAAGAWNVHASLLPRWRGASPMNRAIQSGEKKTGITLMMMDEGLDTGDILLQRETDIDPDETAGELQSRLQKIGCELLIEGIRKAKSGKIERKAQSSEGVAYAGLINKPELEIDWSRTAIEVHNHVRAFSPLPGAKSGKLKILRTRLKDGLTDNLPGTIKEIDREGIVVNTGRGLVLVVQLQPSGKNVMGAADYANGRRLTRGDKIYES